MTTGNRDTDWVLAMAYALGLDSEIKIPISPNREHFKQLFDSIRADALKDLEPTQRRVRNPGGRVWWISRGTAVPLEDRCIPMDGHYMTPAEAFRPGAIVEYTTDIKHEDEDEITKLKVEGTIHEAFDFNDYVTIIGIFHRVTFMIDQLTLVTPAPEEK